MDGMVRFEIWNRWEMGSGEVDENCRMRFSHGGIFFPTALHPPKALSSSDSLVTATFIL